MDEFGYTSLDLGEQVWESSFADAASRIRRNLEKIVDEVVAARSLNEQQASALRWVVVEKKNLYLTGRAGTGKSYLGSAIRETLDKLKVPYASLAVQNATLAPIQGTTIHSYFKFRPGDTEEQVSPLRYDDAQRQTIRSNRVLFVEEVSLVSASLLGMMDKRIREVTNSDEPFGGYQLIFCGDFGQLAPVEGEHAMSSDLWQKVIDANPLCFVRLTQVYRQKDKATLAFLDHVRAGVLTAEDNETIEAIVRKQIPKDAVALYAKNDLVQAHNERRIKEMEMSGAETHTYDAVSWYTPHGSSAVLKDLCKSTSTIPDRVMLGVGALVKVVANFLTQGPYEHRIYNGKLGRVVGFTMSEPPKYGNGVPPNSTPPLPGRGHVEGPGVVVEMDGTAERVVFGVHSWISTRKDPGTLAPVITAVRRQIPLVVAYAMTGHGAQGLTLPCVAVSPESASTNALMYVMMSRATSLEGLYIIRPRECALMREEAAVHNTTALVIRAIKDRAVEANIAYERSMRRKRLLAEMAAESSSSSDSDSDSNSDSESESESESSSGSECSSKRARLE